MSVKIEQPIIKAQVGVEANVQVIHPEPYDVPEERGLKGQECDQCHDMTVFVMDGCRTCVSCGDSKCG